MNSNAYRKCVKNALTCPCLPAWQVWRRHRRTCSGAGLNVLRTPITRTCGGAGVRYAIRWQISSPPFERLLDAAFDLRERLEEAGHRRGLARLERLAV
jgi:hypothetical protein